MKAHSRYQIARKLLLFWCLFIGVGAIFGGTAMLLAPDGSILQMQEMLPYFQVLPFAEYIFQDYIFSGIALLIVNGMTNIIAFILIRKNQKIGLILGGTFGITLMLWIMIQFCIFPTNVLSTSYFVFGLIQAITGYAAFVFYQQESFQTNESNYCNIGTNPKELIVYFSRMGYTKKIAYEQANQSGAMIYEILSTEKTKGTTGFWWCGRFGMHQWKMPIEELKIDIKQFNRITICTPIWVFHVAAPIRNFCESISGKVKHVNYILVHYQKNRYENVVKEMDQIIGIHHENAQSICCRFGMQKHIYKII